MVAAMAASGIIQPAFAVDHTWFGGTGDWGLNTNWSPASVPGASDKAIINSGNATLSFNSGVAALDFFGGSLLGAGNLGISGLTSFTRGQIGGDGGNVIANGGLNISGAGAKTLGHSGGSGSSGIINNGAGTWSGTGDISNWGSGRLTNSAGASLDIQSDADFNNGTFINQGTLTKSAGATDGSEKTVISGTFENSGSVNVQQGVLQVSTPFNNQGTINVSAGAVFYGSNPNFSNDGVMQGNGTIQTLVNNDLVNSGQINPGGAASIGHLTIDGSLHQVAGGALNFDLASLSSFDQLAVTHDVTLGGELDIWNLGYNPVVGDSFVVATFDQRLAGSTFSSVNPEGFGSGVAFSASYHEHDVTLTVTAVPEPEQYLMLLAGLGLVGAIARRRRT